MFAIRTDADTSHSITRIVGRVSFVRRASRCQILILEESQLLVNVQGLQQILYFYERTN